MTVAPARFKIFGHAIEVVALEDHIDECRAVRSVEQGYKDHPWRYNGRVWMDRRAGYRGTTTEWICLRCSDNQCPAWIRVHYQQLMAVLLEHIEGRM